MIHFVRGLALFGTLVPAVTAAAAISGQHAHHHSGHDHTRPGSHAPIGVMGDHLVRQDEIMLSYRYMDMDGSDNKLMISPGMVPTADPNLRGGARIDAPAGINFVTPNLQSLRLAAEAGVPVYQDLDGTQLETDLVFTLGAQFTF